MPTEIVEHKVRDAKIRLYGMVEQLVENMCLTPDELAVVMSETLADYTRRRCEVESKLKFKNVIPPITDSLGKHWKQPPTSAIKITDLTAEMPSWAFFQLAEYSASLPSGSYNGKMWRANANAFSPDKEADWFLLWYHDKDDEKRDIAYSSRRIKIVEA